MELPPETRVHPGHTDPTTIGDEWEHNAFVRVWRGLDPESSDRCTVWEKPRHPRPLGARLRRRPQGLGALGRRRDDIGRASSPGTPGGALSVRRRPLRRRSLARRRPATGRASARRGSPRAGPARPRGCGRIARAAHGCPGAVVELVLAAVGPAAADGTRVATRLALGDLLELGRDRHVRRPALAGLLALLLQLALGPLPMLVERRLVGRVSSWSCRSDSPRHRRQTAVGTHDAKRQHAGNQLFLRTSLHLRASGSAPASSKGSHRLTWFAAGAQSRGDVERLPLLGSRRNVPPNRRSSVTRVTLGGGAHLPASTLAPWNATCSRWRSQGVPRGIR